MVGDGPILAAGFPDCNLFPNSPAPKIFRETFRNPWYKNRRETMVPARFQCDGLREGIFAAGRTKGVLPPGGKYRFRKRGKRRERERD
jgi:hypothetical protein